MAHETPADEPIRGIARNVSWHSGPDESQILSFRVEVVDDVGNVDRHVPVEGLYAKVSAIVADGDEVEVQGPFRPAGTLDLTGDGVPDLLLLDPEAGSVEIFRAGP